MNTDEINQKKSAEIIGKAVEFGHWPAVHGDRWNAEKFNLTELLLKINLSRLF